MFGESTAVAQVFFASVVLNQYRVDGTRSLEVSIELGCSTMPGVRILNAWKKHERHALGSSMLTAPTCLRIASAHGLMAKARLADLFVLRSASFSARADPCVCVHATRVWHVALFTMIVLCGTSYKKPSDGHFFRCERSTRRRPCRCTAPADARAAATARG